MSRQLCISAILFSLAFGVYAKQVNRNPASFRQSGLGVGIILGDPTGVTGKLYLNSKRAVDFGMAFAFGDAFALYGDYLFHFPGAFGRAAKERFFSELSPYVGVGGTFLIAGGDPTPDRRFLSDSSSSVGLGLRIPLGVEWLPVDPPLGVFFELSPGMGFVPRFFALIQVGIGARYYF